MEKVLLLNGSPRANGNIALAFHEMEQVFDELGVAHESILLGHRSSGAASPAKPAGKTTSALLTTSSTSYQTSCKSQTACLSAHLSTSHLPMVHCWRYLTVCFTPI